MFRLYNRNVLLLVMNGNVVPDLLIIISLLCLFQTPAFDHFGEGTFCVFLHGRVHVFNHLIGSQSILIPLRTAVKRQRFYFWRNATTENFRSWKSDALRHVLSVHVIRKQIMRLRNWCCQALMRKENCTEDKRRRVEEQREEAGVVVVSCGFTPHRGPLSIPRWAGGCSCWWSQGTPTLGCRRRGGPGCCSSQSWWRPPGRRPGFCGTRADHRSPPVEAHGPAELTPVIVLCESPSTFINITESTAIQCL